MNIHERRGDIGRIFASDSSPSFTRKPIENTMRGLRESVINRMVERADYFSGDPTVIRTSRAVVAGELQIRFGQRMPNDSERIDAAISGIFRWLQGNTVYLNDVVGKEVLVSAPRMLADLQTPPSALQAILGPLLKREVVDGIRTGEEFYGYQLGNIGVSGCVHLSGGGDVRPKAVEDCDGLALLSASMVKSVGIPVRYVVGGDANPEDGSCDFRHVWTQAMGPSKWIDMDLTRPEATLGWYWPRFGCIEAYPVI